MSTHDLILVLLGCDGIEEIWEILQKKVTSNVAGFERYMRNKKGEGSLNGEK